MPFRVIFAWSQRVRKHSGWSENFWSRQGTLVSAMAAAQSLRPTLQALHGTQTNLDSLTVKSYANSRVTMSQVFRPDQTVISGTDDSDYPTTALLMKLTDPTGDYVTRQWIKGIWDSVTVAGFYKVGDYDKKVQKFLKELMDPNNAWGMRVTLKSNLAKGIEGVSPLGVITVTAHGYTAGTTVRIGGVGGITSVNGVWKVLNPTADTFQLLGYKPLVDPGTWDARGHVRRIEYDFVSIKLAENLGTSKRDVGRPLGQLTGRRTNRR